MTYFAAALTRTPSGWQGKEIDLDDGGLALLLLEQDDEWLGVVRVEGDADPRVFLSDRRAALTSEVAALIWEEEAAPPADEDDEEGSRPVAEPVGDAGLLTDLGTPEDDLLELCAEEGMLPADVLSAVGERAGFAEVLDGLREV